ncbi:hypothetical protein VIBNIFTn2_120103 [Vibrio nigripulchritudo FTn2]|uniref:hypothetical protein n=1 Tax=Vibrio nigripulchritudo TaxID=28173 RepID=UPI0003B1AA46|nr:hypothetical protein [Vibrio nigripulchritudo]CCN40121.1 hypothetical protein VIBNIFTn2_120103 [Vibrio nigripulchritudo FTn2]
MNLNNITAKIPCRIGIHQHSGDANFCTDCGVQLKNVTYKSYLVILRDKRKLLTSALSERHALLNVTLGDPDFPEEEPSIHPCEIKKVIEVKSTRFSDLALL